MDRVLLNRVAGASIRRFLNEVADDLADEASQPAATAHADR
jgi:hypothetical protein